MTTELQKAQDDLLKACFELGKLGNDIDSCYNREDDPSNKLLSAYHLTRLNVEDAAQSFASAYQDAHHTEGWIG